LKGAAPVETPRQGNDSPAPRNLKGTGIFIFNCFNGIFDAPALSNTLGRKMIPLRRNFEYEPLQMAWNTGCYYSSNDLVRTMAIG
jgi:hypothetical protein